jgi:hypothetical protein
MDSLIGFAFRGTVADIDTTVAGEPLHPTTVLVLEVANTLSRIVLPRALAQANRDALNVGTTVEVAGEVQGFPRRAVHVAMDLRQVPTLH